MNEGRTLFEFLFDEDGPIPNASLKGWLRKAKQTHNRCGPAVLGLVSCLLSRCGRAGAGLARVCPSLPLTFPS